MCWRPGNAVRQTNLASGLDPVRAIVYSFRQAYQYLDTWFTPLSLAIVLALLPFLCLVDVEKIVARRIPVLPLLLLAFCFFASAFTPQLFGMGLGWAELRVVNVWFFLFWILLVLVLLAVIQSVRLGALGGRRVDGCAAEDPPLCGFRCRMRMRVRRADGRAQPCRGPILKHFGAAVPAQRRSAGLS